MRLARQSERQGLKIDNRLAAKTAADLGRRYAQIGDIHAEKFCAKGAHHEVPLRGAPQFGFAVFRHAGDAGVVLDVALMYGFRIEGALENDIGFCETRGGIAAAQLHPLGDVRRCIGRRFDTLGEHIFMQNRCAGLHRLGHTDDVRQHLVLDFDELERLARNRGAGRRHGRHRMAVIKDLFARHDVARHIPVVDHQLARRNRFRRHVFEVIASQNGFDTGQGLGLRRVDGLEPRMGMRAAQHPADQHAGQRQVGAKPGAARHLIHAVRTNRPRAHPFQLSVFPFF